MLATFVLAALQITQFEEMGMRFINLDQNYFCIGLPTKITNGPVQFVRPSPDQTRLAILHLGMNPNQFLEAMINGNEKLLVPTVTVWDSQTYQSNSHTMKMSPFAFRDDNWKWAASSQVFYISNQTEKKVELIALSTDLTKTKSTSLSSGDFTPKFYLTSNGIVCVTQKGMWGEEDQQTTITSFDSTLQMQSDLTLNNKLVTYLQATTHPQWMLARDDKSQYALNIVTGEVQSQSPYEPIQLYSSLQNLASAEQLQTVDIPFATDSKAPALIWPLGQTPEDTPETAIPIDMHGISGYVLNNRSYIYYERPEGVYVRKIVKITQSKFREFHKRKIQNEAMIKAKFVATAIQIYLADFDDNFPPKDGFKEKLGPYLKNGEIVKNFEYFMNGESRSSLGDSSKTQIGIVQTEYGIAIAFADGHVIWQDAPGG